MLKVLHLFFASAKKAHFIKEFPLRFRPSLHEAIQLYYLKHPTLLEVW